MISRLGIAKFIPGDPLLLDNLGMVYFDQFNKSGDSDYLDGAEILFEESISQNPGFDLPAGHLESILFIRLSGLAKDRQIHERIVQVDSARMRANPYNQTNLDPLEARLLDRPIVNTGNP